MILKNGKISLVMNMQIQNRFVCIKMGKKRVFPEEKQRRKWKRL